MMQHLQDAAAMRRAATAFRHKADRVAAVASHLDSQVASMSYAGPAADAFREQISVQRWRLQSVARVFNDAAGVLNHHAAQVEANPTSWYGGGS